MNESSTLLTILLFLIPTLFARLCFTIARKRGHNEALWAVLGFFFCQFALIALYLIPKKQPSSAAPIKEQAGQLSVIHNESAASFDDENFEVPRQKRLSANRSLDWYYIDPSENNAIKGPYKIKDLREEINRNKLDCNCYIWCEEFEDWTVVSDFSNSSLILDPDFIE